MFTITKHVEQEEVQPYLVRFENGEPQQRQQQQVRQLKLPTSMQVLVPKAASTASPKTASAASPQPRLEAGQIMTIRRPDGTLVQVVAQRSRQQQQILAPKLPGLVGFFPQISMVFPQISMVFSTDIYGFFELIFCRVDA